MKVILLSVLLALSVEAQETPQEPNNVQLPGYLIDLNDSQAVEDGLIKAYLERAARENYYDAIDGRFGGQKPLTFYVDLYYKQKAQDEALRASQPFDQMLNDALQAEDEIRAKLQDLQGHYNFSVLTIKDFEGQIKRLDARLKSCKKTKGRKC